MSLRCYIHDEPIVKQSRVGPFEEDSERRYLIVEADKSPSNLVEARVAGRILEHLSINTLSTPLIDGS
jgi:hypothetical protein